MMSSRSRPAWAVIVLLILALGASAPSLARQKKHAKRPQARGQSTLPLRQAVSYGKYDFTMQTLEGKQVKLADYGGKVVLVNIWAPWCGPCKSETPGFIRLYEKYKSKGFEIVGVAVQTNEGDVRSFLATYKVPWRVGIKEEVAQNYGTYGLPDNYLFGRDGSLVEHFVGYTNDERLTPSLEKALGQ